MSESGKFAQPDSVVGGTDDTFLRQMSLYLVAVTLIQDEETCYG